MNDGQHNPHGGGARADAPPATAPIAASPLGELHDIAARWLLRCPAQLPGFRCVEVSDAGSGGLTCPIGHRMVRHPVSLLDTSSAGLPRPIFRAAS